MINPLTDFDRNRLIGALEDLASVGLPSPGSAAIFDVGTGPYLQFFESEVLQGLVADGGSTVRVFEGPYGTGKTHLLQLIENLALSRQCAVARADLSQALGFDRPKVLVTHILANVVVTVGRERVISLPSILHALGEVGVDPARLHGVKLPHAGFATAMQVAMTAEPGSPRWMLVSRFLAGEAVGVAHLRAVGVRGVKGPLTDRNAEKVLRTVLAGLAALGAKATILLFDETEPQFGQGQVTQKVRSSANLMRRMIDGSADDRLTRTVTVFAVLPGFLQSCALAYPALGQRLHVQLRSVSSWRSPVLPVESVSMAQDREAFVAAVVDRFVDVAGQLGARPGELRRRLQSDGQDVLELEAGSGYRRALMKRLATTTLDEVSEVGGGR